MGIDSNGFGIINIFKNVKESISSLASETATIVSDIGYCPNPANKSNNISNSSISAAGMAVTAGTLAAADGPLPIVDILGVLSVVAFGIYVLTETDTKHISATGINIERKEVYFPENPYDFNPKGLVPMEIQTPQGLKIKWMKNNGKTEVFRWDQDVKHSPHYHIWAITSTWSGPKRLALHYRPGMIIPEPWASVYF